MTIDSRTLKDRAEVIQKSVPVALTDEELLGIFFHIPRKDLKQAALIKLLNGMTPGHPWYQKIINSVLQKPVPDKELVSIKKLAEACKARPAVSEAMERYYKMCIEGISSGHNKPEALLQLVRIKEIHVNDCPDLAFALLKTSKCSAPDAEDIFLRISPGFQENKVLLEWKKKLQDPDGERRRLLNSLPDDEGTFETYYKRYKMVHQICALIGGYEEFCKKTYGL